MCYHLGELTPGAKRRAAGHLRRCAYCRTELRRLSLALEPTDGCDQPVSAPHGDSLHDVEGLMAKLAALEADLHRSQLRGAALRERVTGALESYLGKNAANALVREVADDGRNLLSFVAPPLTIFLGRRAADNLVGHLIQAAIVRT